MTDIPTKLSDLNNDSGFIDNTVNNLTNYYKKTETYSQAEINSLIGAVSSLDIEIVETLPTQDISTTTIYLVPTSSSSTNNAYDEYIYVSNSWEKIGSTDVDLSNYQEKIDSSHKLDSDLVDDTNQTNKFVTTTEKSTWNAKYDKPSSGIPSTDMSSAVQTSLGKADTAIQDISGKQDVLTAGDNISITNNVISATDTTYTAGTGIDITNGVISNTQTSAEWGNITGTLSNQTDLNTALGDKQATLVSGTNIKTINNESILGSGNITVGGNEIYIGDEQDAPQGTKLVIDDDTVDFIATPENTYTTTEKRVGTWIDGKPLYQKTVYISSLPNNETKTYNVFSDTSIIDLAFIDYTASFVKETATVTSSLNSYYTGGYFLFTALVNWEIMMVNNSNASSRSAYITVKYTKTTDTVGGGN